MDWLKLTHCKALDERIVEFAFGEEALLVNTSDWEAFFQTKSALIALLEAAQKGHRPILEFAKQNKLAARHMWFDVILVCAKEGHLHILKWMNTWFDKGVSQFAMQAGCQQNVKEVVKWCLEIDPGNANEGMRIATIYDRPQLLELLLPYVSLQDPIYCVGYNAVLNDSVQSAKWSIKQNVDTAWLQMLAFTHGSIKIVKHLVEELGAEVLLEDFLMGCSSGNLELVRWVGFQHKNWLAGAIELLFKNCNFDERMLLWLWEQGAPIDVDRMFGQACLSGKTEFSKLFLSWADDPQATLDTTRNIRKYFTIGQ